MIDFTLRNGTYIPSIGYGTWKLENGAATVQSVSNAIECGYRHIDTAAAYGNGFSIGKAIKNCGTERKSLFISNKLWNAARGDLTCDACKKNLKLMKLDYFDLFLIHWPASPAVHSDWKDINALTWSQMELLYNEGTVKSIGVSNFLPRHLEALKENSQIVPMVNQIEFHPGYYQKETLDYCNTNGILVAAWSPLGSGQLLDSPIINKLAKKYMKSPAQICIKWCLQHGVLPIVKSQNPIRMKENIDIENFELSNEDMSELDNMPRTAYSGLNPDTITQFD
jgi:diketogulonate reductase-like aldo/keto reductase